jgi:hypothetical protein
MNEAFEPVEIRDRPQVDDDGDLIPGTGSVTVTCLVQPLVLDQDVNVDREGTSEQLRVFAPAGTSVSAESEVVIRGRVFRVVEPPHDYAAFRRPRLARHHPSTVFVCERGEG